MIDPLKNRYVNWMDGMKMSEKHFHQLQHTIEEKLKDSHAIQLNAFNFGILPEAFQGKKPLDYTLQISGDGSVQIEINQCRAITAAGDRVELLAHTDAEGKAPLAGKVALELGALESGTRFYAGISVHQERMQPFGTPEASEAPPRMPFTAPELKLCLLPDTENAELYRNTVIIARLTIHNQKLVQDADYIPPCRQMASHDDLRDFAFKYIQFIENIESHAFAILRNMGRKDKLTNLATSVGNLARVLLHTIELHLDALIMHKEVSSPANFLLNAKQLSRALRNVIELLPSEDKEELLNYIQEVIDVSPAEYLKTNAQIIALEYDHFSIREVMQVILQFCRTNGKLFSEWSSLDYIGKKKKTGIFVGEVTKDVEPGREKKKWDF